MSHSMPQPGPPSPNDAPGSKQSPIATGESNQEDQGLSLDQLNPLLPAAEQRRLMYGALVFWVLISVFVIWRPFVLEVPPVRLVVTLLLALPIAIFWFIFWPQKLVARIAPSPYIQVPLLLAGPVVLFLLFWGMIEWPLRTFVAPPGKAFEVRTVEGANYAIHHYPDAELIRTTGNKTRVQAYFVPYAEKVRNGHLQAIHVVFEPTESEFTATYRPTAVHKAVFVTFRRSQDYVEIPEALLEDQN